MACFRASVGAGKRDSSKLVHWIHPTTQKPYIVWHVQIRPNFVDEWFYFIDAASGEDVALPDSFPSGALRNLANPHNGGAKYLNTGWQPAHVNEFITLPIYRDNGGVHANSGAFLKVE